VEAATERSGDEGFIWKGGGSGLAEVWEAPGMYVEAPKGSGVEWFFLDVGSKNSKSPPILLLHGLPAYSFMWRDVLPILTSANRRCIAVDLPGFGNSTMMQVWI
jgi:pimeloyl-ACP methyl ester carboxylesterase